MNASTVSSSGFDGAASLFVFQLRVQEGTTQSALTKASVAKSFPHVGDVVARRGEHIPRMRPGGRPTCEKHARDTSHLFSPLAATQSWSGVCSSNASVEFYQTTVKAAVH